MDVIFSKGTLWVLLLASLTCIITPIVFIFRYKKHYNARVSSFFIGTGIYLLVGMIFFQLLLVSLFSLLPSVPQIPWQSALYQALLATILSSFSRYLMLNYGFKNRNDIGNALMFGVGQGGFYAMAYGTSLCAANAVTMLLNNYLGTNAYLEKLNFRGEELKTARQSIQRLYEIPTIQHFFDGTVPLLILFMEIALSVLMYTFIREANARFLLPLSFVLQFIIMLSFYLEKEDVLASPPIALSIIIAITFILFHQTKKINPLPIRKKD